MPEIRSTVLCRCEVKSLLSQASRYAKKLSSTDNLCHEHIKRVTMKQVRCEANLRRNQAQRPANREVTFRGGFCY